MSDANLEDMSDVNIENIVKDIANEYDLVLDADDPMFVVCTYMIKVFIKQDDKRSSRVSRELNEALQKCFEGFDDKEDDLKRGLGMWGGRIQAELEAGLDRVKGSSQKMEKMLERWDNEFDKSKGHIANQVKKMEESLKKGGIVKSGGDSGWYWKWIACAGLGFSLLNAFAVMMLLFSLPS